MHLFDLPRGRCAIVGFTPATRFVMPTALLCAIHARKPPHLDSHRTLRASKPALD